MSAPTPDYPDWSTPVHQVDQAVKLTPLATVIGPNNSIGPYDTSHLDSVGIQLTLPAGTGANRCMLSLEWSEAGFTVATDYLTYADATAYAGSCNILQWQVPVRGGSLRVRQRGDNANSSAIVVTGSTRTLLGPELSAIPSGSGGGVGAITGRALWFSGSTNIAAGASSQTFYIPPVAKAIRMWIGGTFTTGYCQISSPVWLSGAMTAQLVAYLDRSASNQVFDPINVPGMGLELIFHNSDAATHSFNFAAWDVS